MQHLSVKRTLVKSPPELWSELSEVERLARHLDAFGEIKITRLEPESTVAWEGEGASGTVSIEPSGWGTKVILTAELAANGDPPEPGADHAGEPAGAGEKAAGDIAEMEATADEPAGDIAETEATADEPAGDIAEMEATADEPAGDIAETKATADEPAGDIAEMDATSEELAAHLDAAHPPVGEIPPAAALTFDPAAAPATGAGPRTGADARTAPPRRRRGFWARLFGGWLVPEERLNRTPVEPPHEAPTITATPELDEKSTEDQPPDESGEVPSIPATETPGADVEPADRLAEEKPECSPDEPAQEAPSEIDREGARAVLEEILDALGSAHHRPYSRG